MDETPVGTFLGHSLLDESAGARAYGWVLPVTVVATAISSAAILRAVGRIFFAVGTPDDPLLSEEPPEELPETRANQPLMITVTGVLVALGLVASLVPGLQDRSEAAAARFRDRHAYVERVLGRKRIAYEVPSAVLHAAKPKSVLYGAGAGALMLIGAALGLYRRRLPGRVRSGAGRVLDPPVAVLKAVHSGLVADYVVWMTVGTALVGGIWALTLR